MKAPSKANFSHFCAVRKLWLLLCNNRFLLCDKTTEPPTAASLFASATCDARSVRRYNLDVSEVVHNINQIRERIRSTAERAGHRSEALLQYCRPQDGRPERIEDALAAGQTLFGESRVQEAKARFPLVSGRAHWHMIGHLQTNKAREAVALFEVIHSVDSVKLAAELSKCAERAGKTQAILLEVNVSGEASKFGLKPEDLEFTLTEINRLPRLEVQGLMTIAPYAEESSKARAVLSPFAGATRCAPFAGAFDGHDTRF